MRQVQLKRGVLAAALLMSTALAWSQQSPEGLWKTIDDKTKVEKALVRITEASGVLSGKIEKRLDPAAKPEDVCDQCSGSDKGKPILGFVIVRGVKKSTSDDNVWSGGTITDPASGKEYKVTMSLDNGGKTMKVRGYIGAPLLGRTQVWTRVE